MNRTNTMTTLVFTLAGALISLSALAQSPAPISLHPENPHYFLWHDKPTVLVTSAEHYGAVLNLDFDYVRYLGALKKDGLNLTRTFSGTYVEVPNSNNITDNTLAPEASRYITPWARSTEPGLNGQGQKFDLSQWDPAYFKRLKAFMTAAAQSGVVVEFTLFCTLYDAPVWSASPMNAENNINGIGTCPPAEVLTLAHDDLTAVQVAVTRKLVQELKDFDNVIYEVCNEPYEGALASLPWQNRIVDTIVEEERALGVKHLISMNIANKQARVDAPHPDVQVLNFHYAYPPDAVAINFDHGRVIGDNETGFNGREDFAYRSEAWDFMLAGGGLFNNLDWGFTPGHPEGDLTDFTSPGGGGPTIRRQVGLLKQYLEGFNFIKMQPLPSCVTQESTAFHVQVLAEPGVAYAVYVRMNRDTQAAGVPMHAEFELELSGGTYAVEWLNPKTGEKTAGEAIVHSGGKHHVKSPAFFEDIAVAIRKK